MANPRTTRPLGDRLYARITPDQCEALHEAALHILEHTGARLPLPSAVACCATPERWSATATACASPASWSSGRSSARPAA